MNTVARLQEENRIVPLSLLFPSNSPLSLIFHYQGSFLVDDLLLRLRYFIIGKRTSPWLRSSPYYSSLLSFYFFSLSLCLSLSLSLLISKEAQRRFASFDTRQIYLYSSRALCAKASDPGPLEYVYAGNVERGNGRFQVTRKRLTKIFKRDAGRAARGCLLSLHHAIMENESQTSPRSSISWKIAPILLLPFPPRFFFEITPRF